MDGKSLVYGVVSIVIAVLVTVVILVPVVAESTQATDTLTNEGYMRYTSISDTDDDEIVIVWDHTKPSKITINDVEKDVIYPSGLTMSIAFADNFCFRFNTNAMDCYGESGNTVSASTTAGTDVTLTLSSGTATVVNTASTPDTATYTYTTAYYPDDDGEYIMKNKDKSAYVHPDSTIIIANGMSVVGSRVGVFFDGTIEDGYTFSYFNTTLTVEESDVVTTYADVDEYSDVVALSKIDMHLTKGVDEADATYSYFLVPYEVVAEKSIHPDATLSAILNIIPILVIVGIVLGCVGLIAYRRF